MWAQRARCTQSGSLGAHTLTQLHTGTHRNAYSYTPSHTHAHTFLPALLRRYANKPQAGRGREGQGSTFTDYCRREEERGGFCQFFTQRPARTRTCTSTRTTRGIINLSVAGYTASCTNAHNKKMYASKMFAQNDKISRTAHTSCSDNMHTHRHTHLCTVWHVY